ncbi:hscB [Symbiodinium sp. KB8]|nr:hscB [Symbiodinium sp. KB8]
MTRRSTDEGYQEGRWDADDIPTRLLIVLARSAANVPAFPLAEMTPPGSCARKLLEDDPVHQKCLESFGSADDKKGAALPEPPATLMARLAAKSTIPRGKVDGEGGGESGAPGMPTPGNVFADLRQGDDQLPLRSKGSPKQSPKKEEAPTQVRAKRARTEATEDKGITTGISEIQQQAIKLWTTNITGISEIQKETIKVWTTNEGCHDIQQYRRGHDLSREQQDKQAELANMDNVLMSALTQCYAQFILGLGTGGSLWVTMRGLLMMDRLDQVCPSGWAEWELALLTHPGRRRQLRWGPVSGVMIDVLLVPFGVNVLAHLYVTALNSGLRARGWLLPFRHAASCEILQGSATRSLGSTLGRLGLPEVHAFHGYVTCLQARVDKMDFTSGEAFDTDFCNVPSLTGAFRECLSGAFDMDTKLYERKIRRGSRQARRVLFGDLRAKLPVFLEHSGAVRIDLVTHYKHLGSHLSFDGSLATEIKYRLALGRAAFKEGRQRLFACRKVPLEKRAFLFRSYVLSAVMAGAGTWPWLSTSEWQLFSGGIIGLYRQLLCLKAEGGYEVTTPQILFRCGLPSPSSLLAAARLRFLCQLTRHGPDPAWALLRWYTPFQRALEAACGWLLQAVEGTSSLQDPATRWDTWHSLITDRPGLWKGLIRRAEAWHSEVIAMSALFDSASRRIWQPASLARPVSGLADCNHACLLCGLAFRTQQAWGAHAHRAHGYLSPAHQHAQGRRCPACGLTVANLTRLRKHFKTSAVCLQVAQGCFEVSTFPLDLTPGHLQFPATGGEARTTLPAARAVTCQPLARDLARLTDADDVAIFETVKNHIEPLPVLRLTLQQWIDSLDDGHLRVSGQDVLLILHAEHLCTGISGKCTEPTVSESAFEPAVQPLPATLPVSLAPVAWTGGLCSSWLSFWSLGSHPTVPLDWPLQPSGALLDASAICCVVPAPPFPGLGFREPSPCRLRSLRANRLWLGQTLSSVELLLQRAREGAPVLLRIPVPLEALRPFSEWLELQAAPSGATSHYALLGLAESFEVDQVQLEAKYKELQRQFHPDRHVASSEEDKAAAEEQSARVNEAVAILRTPLRRAEYWMTSRSLLAAMATTHYWRAVLHAHGGDQEKLKEVVVKDAEIVGILGALVLTITVAGLAVVDAKLAKSSLVRTLYVALAFCSFVFSLISLMISSRLLLSINRLPAKDALACLEELDRAGAAHAYWWFSRSLLFLLFAVLISVYLLYDSLCFAICSIFTFLPLWMMYHLHRVHVGVVWPMMNFSPLAADSRDDTSDSADPGDTLQKSSRTRSRDLNRC